MMGAGGPGGGMPGMPGGKMPSQEELSRMMDQLKGPGGGGPKLPGLGGGLPPGFPFKK
jgi:signal recognition particle subunit SRP54